MKFYEYLSDDSEGRRTLQFNSLHSVITFTKEKWNIRTSIHCFQEHKLQCVCNYAVRCWDCIGSVIDEYMSVAYWWANTDWGKLKPFPAVTLSITNPTSTAVRWNTGLRGERLATNCLSHGTARGERLATNCLSHGTARYFCCMTTLYHVFH
jgi:hypothetical protein